MVTVSHLVKKTVNSRPMLQEALIEGIVNFAYLAETLQPRIESEFGDEIKKSAIVMALRRYSEELRKKTIVQPPFKFNPEIVMKTNLCDICIVKTPSAQGKIRELYQIVDYEKGDTLNIIQGNYEITIVVSQKHLEKLRKIFGGEKILNIEHDLISLTLSMTKEFLYTPGILSLVTRKLTWENINIFENISTMTELIFIVDQKDAVRAYNAFQEILRAYSP